jgi:hypothetical protein
VVYVDLAGEFLAQRLFLKLLEALRSQRLLFPLQFMYRNSSGRRESTFEKFYRNFYDFAFLIHLAPELGGQVDVRKPG